MARKRSRSRRRTRSCPRGQIRRKAYTKSPYRRRAYTDRRGRRVSAARVGSAHFPSTCVKDMGKRGKTPASKRVLPKLTPGRLGKYGYQTGKSARARHMALGKAVRKEGYATIVRRVVAASNYMKRTAPSSHAKMLSDLSWMGHTLKSKYGCRKSTRHASRRRKGCSTRRTVKHRRSSRRRRRSSRKRRNSSGGRRRRSSRNSSGGRRRRSSRKRRNSSGGRRRRSSRKRRASSGGRRRRRRSSRSRRSSRRP